MDKIAEFVRKKRVIHDETPKVEIKEVKIPWYKRPLEASEFIIRKGKDKKYYIQHKEWSKRVWIGPYKNKNEVDTIIESYVVESLKFTSLDKKVNNTVHSLIVEDEKIFFGD
jgi:hypothetical protein